MTAISPTSKLQKDVFILDSSDRIIGAMRTDASVDGALRVKHLRQTEALFAIRPSVERPYAVIADYNLLCKDDFALPKAMRRHPILKYVPLIAINDNAQKFNADAIKYGIDDIYTVPLDWAAILNRIEFLYVFKQEIQAEIGRSDTEPKEIFKMPLSKRLFDLIGATIILIILSPLFLIVALLIRLESRGPIFYRSKRAGVGYQVFDFWKFRSMFPDADKRLKDLQHLNQYENNGTGPTFVKIANDPRITKIGKWIRNSSIDELPQLFNVLKGDMSLVGNRPLPLYEAEQLTSDEWALRFLAPAGMTGLWQVTKRGKGGAMSVEERIGLDLTYAKNYSVWYDIKLILKTIPALFQKENV
jgi:lipopolysaccharide/colanic/teichoic acid biosynthesis glycosyltransferase